MSSGTTSGVGVGTDPYRHPLTVEFSPVHQNGDPITLVTRNDPSGDPDPVRFSDGDPDPSFQRRFLSPVTTWSNLWSSGPVVERTGRLDRNGQSGPGPVVLNSFLGSSVDH